jgi:hypothetical protein
MDEAGFRRFLKRAGKSENAARRSIRYTAEFEAYLQETHSITLDEAAAGDLRDFAEQVGAVSPVPARRRLWGIRYYYQFARNPALSEAAGQLRAAYTHHSPADLWQLCSDHPEYVVRLFRAGIGSSRDLLAAGRTRHDRQILAEKTGIPLRAVDEYIKLADLRRISGIPAWLYYEAGIDTLDKLAAADPDQLRNRLAGDPERIPHGMPPPPREIRRTVEQARQMIRIVEY